MDPTANRIVERFDLKPHPEGGYFREVYRSSVSLPHPAIPADRNPARTTGTLIYFLLEGSAFSAFHRVRWSDEVWHLYAGGPIELNVIATDASHSRRLLSCDFDIGEPTTVVPAGHWQAARLAGRTPWAFGGCTVSPGFEFEDFDMPPAAELIAAYPDHAGLIRQLTRA